MKPFITTLILFISLQAFSQQHIFVTSGSSLYSMDLNNCTSRFVGNMNNNEFGDIALTPDGRLWGFENGSLFKIDTTNAQTTLVGTNRLGGVSLVDLNDSTLLMEYKDSLWAMNDSTLAVQNLGYIGYQASGDLTWYDDDLYMTSGWLIKIVLNSANTAIISSEKVNDKPLGYDFEGIVTASFPGLANSIVGWTIQSSYKICPIDGTVQLLCDSTVAGVPGAAAIRLPTQNPMPTSCSEIFPIHLLNFSATPLNKTVNLQWQTATEINSNYFLIERSSDGTNFATIGKQTAAGNSSVLKQYTFTDNAPLSTNYYRLKEVDLNGNATFSNILLVKMQQPSALTILQNPVQNTLQVQVNSGSPTTSSLLLYDFSGRRLKTLSVSNGLQTIDVSSLPAGAYLLQLISTDGQLFNERFVKGE